VSAATATSTSILFEPIDVGPLRMKNRIVMSPMGSCLDEDGYITDAAIAYYRRRAAGGVGTITVESFLIDAEMISPEPRIHGREFLPGIRRLVETLRSYEDLTVGVQLMHPGRQVWEGPGKAPSPVPLNPRSPVPHPVTKGEIDAIMEQYAFAAALAKEAGFQFVEVHGAHGYLPSSFLSPLVNQREDEYGGSLENRARFSLEVAGAMKPVLGDTPLFWRISGVEGQSGGYEIEDAVQVCQWLEQAGVQCITVSAGTWLALHLTVAPMFQPRGLMVPYASAVKKAVNVPIMAVGRLDDPHLAAQVVADGDADFIILGRGLLADPDWPMKVEEGRFDEVRPCIACNACNDLVSRHKPAQCSVNPELGRELTFRLEPSARTRRVMVVGSGPAGMEAARVARLRGHEVSIWEADDKLGGKLEVAGSAPSKNEVLRFRDYQARLIGELGVEIHTGTFVTPDVVESADPDVVLVSTGAEPLIPPIPGVNSPNVFDAQAFLHGHLHVEPGEKIVVVGGSATGCEAAEWLVERGVHVTIIEMLRSVGHGIELITRRHLLRQLRADGVEILTNSKVTMIEPEARKVLYESTEDGSQGEVEADKVAMAIGWRPRGSALADELGSRRVIVLGDASRPADFVAAINAGADAGNAV
jgi:2,4-dienoyl-CoA reductase-like NADH-dependent reductase (Old Yellow Enzyme family)/thioredoxin reductase